jgi:phosphoglycolate phosphatase-like HAD superfamily hydrolase
VTPRGDAAIFDVDGTLCDVTSIRHHVVLSHPENKGYKDFEKFHRASVWCPPIRATLDAVREHQAKGHGIIVVTARKERWRPETTGWLEGLVEYDELWMRADADDRPDYAVKADLLRKIRARGWNVVRAFDDNPSIIKLWRMEGIETTVVPGWIE